MSLDDYINRVPVVPPKVDFTEQQSSLDVDYPPLDPGRTHITNSVPANRPANSTVPRFSLGYWTAQHTDDSVATVLPSGADRLVLTSSFRTNRDKSALLWSSKDTLAHQITSYVENVNYENIVLAFQHNTSNPGKFTATIVNSVGTFLYRLVPYALNQVTNKYECLDKKYGTNKTYPESVYDRTKPNIDGIPYEGRTNYIFILDFNDLRQGHNFTGGLIDPRKISSIALDVLPAKHALGPNAFVARITDISPGLCRLELGGVQDTAKLSAGDVITGMLTYINGSDTLVTVNTRWVVVNSGGFGSSNRTVTVEGSMPGGFIDFPVMYSRDLQVASVIGATESTHLFGNFLLTGTGVRTMGKRTYTQDVHGLNMSSDLDDDHKMQPKRLVDSVTALGYRQGWNFSLGSKSYFQGTTTLQKIGDAAVTDGQATEWPVLYAGEAQLNGHYVVGRAPNRGIDKLHDDVTDEWDDNFAGIMPYNGTTKNSSAEAAAMPVGGSYWWDLELDLPGPALLAAVAAMRGRTPKGIVWCLGDSDAVAIDTPGNRIPVPTVARAKQATEKIFAYFRTLWGGTLPIWIQEQAWGWVGTDPVDPTDPGTNVPVKKGAPTYLRARRTAYGDLLLEWKSYDLDPLLASYRVEIYNPIKIGEILHTFTVPGTQQENDYIYADWSVEDNGPVRALVDTGDDVWAGLRWRVVSISALGQVPSVTKSGLVPIDNTLIERVIVCGPNLYMGNYFTGVSDPTHAVSREYLQASTIMRRRYCEELQMRRHKVMPLNVSDEDRGDEDTDLEDQKFGRILKDWWNLELGFPGTSLVAAIAKVNALGRPVAHIAMGQPGEVELFRTMAPGDILAQLADLRQASIEMLAFLRTVWSKPDLCMWLQGPTSIWMGIPGVTPININEMATEAAKESQSAQCIASPDFFLGSYVPGSDNYHNFQAVGLERKYPTPAVYNATAHEMGESMALLIDRAVIDPGCPPMMLSVDPQYGPWGTGWYALYAGVGNTVYPPAGTVDIVNNRLAYLNIASTGPASMTIGVIGTVAPLEGGSVVYPLNGVITQPNDLINVDPVFPVWGPFYSDGTVPEGGLRYSDNTLIFQFSPYSHIAMAAQLKCKVYDDSAMGALVYETDLYRAGNTSSLDVAIYTEKPINDATLVPTPEYGLKYAVPPFNPAVNFVGHNLRFVITTQSGVFPYFNQTSVGIWGNADTDIGAIKLLKNGSGTPVSLTPIFTPVPMSPAGMTGQWRASLPEAVFELTAEDTIQVLLEQVCDHDTGSGCDDPTIVIVEGLEYKVSPVLASENGGYVAIWASIDSGTFAPLGSITPSDYLGLFELTPGMEVVGGSFLPATNIYRWGQGDEGFTSVTVRYNGIDHDFPVIWQAAPSYQGNGVWIYGQVGAAFDMSAGGPITLTWHGGIAASREISVCCSCNTYEWNMTAARMDIDVDPGEEDEVFMSGYAETSIIPPKPQYGTVSGVGSERLRFAYSFWYDPAFPPLEDHFSIEFKGNQNEGFTKGYVTYLGETKECDLFWFPQGANPDLPSDAPFDGHWSGSFYGSDVPRIPGGAEFTFAVAKTAGCCGDGPITPFNSFLMMTGTEQGPLADKESRVGATVMPWYSGELFPKNYSGPRVMHTDDSGQYFQVVAQDEFGAILPQAEQPTDWQIEVVSGAASQIGVFTAQQLIDGGFTSVLKPYYVPGASLIIIVAGIGVPVRVRYWSPTHEGTEGFITVQQAMHRIRLLPRAEQPAYISQQTLEFSSPPGACIGGNNNLYQTLDPNDLSGGTEFAPFWPQATNQLWYETPPASQVVLDDTTMGDASFSYNPTFIPTEGGPWIDQKIYEDGEYWTEKVAQYLNSIAPSSAGVVIGQLFFGPESSSEAPVVVPHPGQLINVIMKSQVVPASAVDMVMGGSIDDAAKTFTKKTYESVIVAPLVTEDPTGFWLQPGPLTPAYYFGPFINDYTRGGSCPSSWGDLHNNIIYSPYVVFEREVEPPIMN